MASIDKIIGTRWVTDLYLLFIAVALPWQARSVVRKAVSPFNLINGLLVGVIIFWLLVRGPKPKWPLLVPMYLYLLGSLIGMFNSQAILMNLYTLMQDAYLYLWCVVLCTLLDKEGRVKLLIAAWLITLVVVLSTEGFIAHGGGANRLEFTFRNANRAGAYFMFSFFLLFHPVVPWLIKFVLGFLIIMAIGSTGSAASSIGTSLGSVVMLGSFAYARGPIQVRPLYAAGIVVIILFGILHNPLAKSSLPTVLGELAPTASGRIDRSADVRKDIWAKGWESFREHPLGIGPASFHAQIESGIGLEGSIELHSDFVAGLVERGVVGFAGFILMLAWIGRDVFRSLHLSFLSPDRSDSIWAAGLAGACTTYFFYSTTHEAMHHDSYWLLLALVVSQVAILRRKLECSASGVTGEASTPKRGVQYRTGSS